MMRSSCLLLLLVALGILSYSQSASAQADLTAGQALVQAINGWRLEQDLWPLRENATLERMAVDQANYILSLPSIPEGGAIHAGATGAGPMERSRFPQYNWPAYGRADYTAIGEIAYVGRSASAARGFWETSPVHRTAALNPAYREIGVAALPHRFGYLYIVVFGSRPNVFPATADTQADVLYLSNERYRWARSPWIDNIGKIRLFDADGRPLSADWVNWQAEMPLPDDVGDELFVEYLDDDNLMAIAEVDLESTESALPPSTPAPNATPTRAQTTAPSATPRAVQMGTPSATLQATQTTRPGAATATQGAAVPATVSAPTGNNILLLYDARSFTLLNSGQTPINVREIVFQGVGQLFPVTSWETQWLSGSLTAFAASDCLQVWSWQETAALNAPTRCRQRRSVLTIAPNAMFWKQGDFEVRWRNAALVTCRAADTQCEFAVP